MIPRRALEEKRCFISPVGSPSNDRDKSRVHRARLLVTVITPLMDRRD